MLICFNAASALAGEVYTGASGFTIALPAGWIALIGGDEEDGAFMEDLEPGDEEAMFCSGDGAVSVTVYCADETPVEADAVAALFSEPSLEARVAGVNGYQKIFYRYDEPNRRAFISYSLMDSEDRIVHTEYLVGFVTGSQIAQYLIISVPQDQHDARFELISEIVNSIDVGGVREGAEG